MARAGFQSHRASLIGGSDTILLSQVQHAEDATHRCLAEVLMHGLTQSTDVRSGYFGAAKQLLRAQRCSCGTILLLNAVASALLRMCSRSNCPLSGSINRTCAAFHCT